MLRRRRCHGVLWVTLVIVVASTAACDSKPESAALAADPRVTLPVVDDAQPFNEKDAIEVTVFRTSGARQGGPDTHGANAALEAWRIELESTVYEFGTESERRLAEELMRLGKAKVKDAAKGISGRTLLLRADAEAPVEIVKQVLEAAAYGRIPRVFYVVRAGSQGTIGVIPCPLPEDAGGGYVPSASGRAVVGLGRERPSPNGGSHEARADSTGCRPDDRFPARRHSAGTRR